MREHDEIVKDIKTVLEEKVAPSVAAHNGAIGFILILITLFSCTQELSDTGFYDEEDLLYSITEYIEANQDEYGQFLEIKDLAAVLRRAEFDVAKHLRHAEGWSKV